ncbi:hypothetical protein BJ508DRAFT_417651 [Ascobolus immersus RN42]|uniref:Exonuclease domain-containing protein n=1 Tax=Ascobolus immersus RN42 TaxID=1160509 RepID=A0A3N4HV13_ASCIM|nr:hypothetical protein BJ508DRAFT_417651 [Ascobolus immersus RN42]
MNSSRTTAPTLLKTTLSKPPAPLKLAKPPTTSRPAISRPAPAPPPPKTTQAQTGRVLPQLKARELKATELLPRAVPNPPEKHGTRLTLLRLLHAENARLYQVPETDEMLMELSVQEEQKVATEKRVGYAAIMKLRVTKLRKTKLEDWAEERKRFQLAKKRVSGELPTEAKPANPTGTPIKPPKEEKDPSTFRLDTGMDEETELEKLRELCHDKELLVKNGFLMTAPPDAEIEQARLAQASSDGYEVCDRCRSRFKILENPSPEGALCYPTGCRYHYGRPYLPNTTSGFASVDRAVQEKIYSCCQEPLGLTGGCTTATYHVFKTSSPPRLALVMPFLNTTDSPFTSEPAPTKAKAFSLDCEMAYTTRGLELVRVTLLYFPSHEPALDALVIPLGKMLNHNTRFSGVSASMYDKAKAYTPTHRFAHPNGPLPVISSPYAARDILLREFLLPDTVLVGHALENDLTSLRIIHDKIVDSAVLWPNRRGLPFKNKLKFLVERHLGLKIQQDEAGSAEIGDENDEVEGSGAKGHDSFLDARCAAEMVRLRIKEPKVVKEVRKRPREEAPDNSVAGVMKRMKDGGQAGKPDTEEGGVAKKQRLDPAAPRKEAPGLRMAPAKVRKAPLLSSRVKVPGPGVSLADWMRVEAQKGREKIEEERRESGRVPGGLEGVKVVNEEEIEIELG